MPSKKCVVADDEEYHRTLSPLVPTVAVMVGFSPKKVSPVVIAYVGVPIDGHAMGFIVTCLSTDSQDPLPL